MSNLTHMVLYNDPEMSGAEGYNPDCEIIVVYDGDRMFMSHEEAEELVAELSTMYERCTYRIVKLP